VGQRDAKETEGAKQTKYKPIGNQGKGYTLLHKNKRMQSNKRERKSAVRLMKWTGCCCLQNLRMNCYKH